MSATAVLLGALVGACGGSFVATFVLRATRDEQALAGRSRCDHCSEPLGFASTIPIISYGLARGACVRCQGRIDPLHPIGECVGALVGLMIMLTPSAMQPAWIERIDLFALAWLLLGLSLYDLKTLRLPDLAVVGVLGLCLILAALKGALIPGLLAGLITFALLEGVRWSFDRLRGTAGLGGGDVKFLAALAVWLQMLTPWAVVLACVLALGGRLLSRRLQGRAAFGPALASAAWIVGLGLEGALWTP